MKIIVITFCKNEEMILPWFLRHYSFADEIHIHDDGSTDHSLEIIQATPKTTIIKNTEPHIPPNGEFGNSFDYFLLNRKNSYYKTLDADWYIIVDIDEFIWHKRNIRAYLEECQKTKIELPQIMGYNMYGEWPQNDGFSQLIDLIKQGTFDPYLYSKFAVVYKTIDINYNIGAHNCCPKNPYFMYSARADLKLFHYGFMNTKWWVERHHKYVGNTAIQWDPTPVLKRMEAEKARCIDVTTDSTVWSHF